MVRSRVLLLMLLLLDIAMSYSPDLLSLKIKIGIEKTAPIPTTTTIPLPPYLHPALSSSHVRVKRGADEVLPPRGDEDIINAPDLLPDSQAQQQTEKEKEKEECYFKRDRQTMSELIGVQYTNQYGSPHALALIFARGAGEYYDWNDKNKIDEVGKRFICHEHETELGSNWANKGYNHFKIKESKGGTIHPVCSMPHPFFKHKPMFPLEHEVHRVEAQEAESILKKKGVLVHPGIPICSAHDQLARKVTAQVEVEGEGHVIRPAPIDGDFSETPAISRNDNPFFDERDPKDSSYHPKHYPSLDEGLPEKKTADEIKKAYTAFMHALGLRPLIGFKEWHRLVDRSQRRHVEALKHAAYAIASRMSPDNPQALMDRAFKPPLDYERPRPEKYEQMMLNVKEVFETSDTYRDRLACISLVVHFTLPEIHRYIPGLKDWFFAKAKRFARKGYHQDPVSHRQINYNWVKVERFIRFLTRRVKDTQNRWIKIPNTVRKLRIGEIYHLYKNELEHNGEDKFLLLPESTVKKMIHICKAERRKSLHGVDITSFDNSETMIDTMLNDYGIDKSWHASLISKAKQTRQYIRTDYLIHVKEYSSIVDHCWTYALSDPENTDHRLVWAERNALACLPRNCKHQWRIPYTCSHSYLRHQRTTGAYKSSSTISSIQAIAKEVEGISVSGYYFSEAQVGKGPCDRTSAIVKGVTRSYADAGGKVLNPQEFYHAVTTSRHREGISYHLVHLEGSGKDKKPKLSTSKIPEMSKMNSFTFEEKNVRLHRFRDIGTGKTWPYKKMQPNDARLIVKASGGTIATDTFWRKLGDPKYVDKKGNPVDEEKEEAACEQKKDKEKCKERRRKLESTLFECPIESCSKEFLTERNLEKHMAVGKHQKRDEKMNIQDCALNRFAAWLEKAVTPQEIYEEGKRNNAKTDAREAEKLMRQATDDNGHRRFQPNELLTSRQIASVHYTPYTSFKNNALDKRDRVPARGSRTKRSTDDSVTDEVNALFDTEGDPELEWETEPLFDEAEDYREAIKKAHNELFDGNECDDVANRGWLPIPKQLRHCTTY